MAFAAAAVVLLAASSVRAEDGGRPFPYLVTTDTLAVWMGQGNLRIVDIRLPGDFHGRGHIPGSVRIPWTDFAHDRERGGWPTEDPSRIAEIFRRLSVQDRNVRIVAVGDAPDDWGAAGYAVYAFRQWGLPNVAMLTGGFSLWKTQKRPVSHGFDEPPPLRETPSGVPIASPVPMPPEAVLDAVQYEKAVLIDVRSSAEFNGAVLFGERRGGRIPGAVNIDWRRFLIDATGLLRAGEIGNFLLEQGITPQRPVILYDTAGLRSAMVWCALRQEGYPDTRLYAGGFREWTAREDLRIELPQH